MRFTQFFTLLRGLQTRRDLDELPVATAPSAERVPAPDASELAPASEEFRDLLESVGAIAPARDANAQLALRDTTIVELRGMLANLSGIGDELARTERERLRLAARVEELEREAAEPAPPDPVVARLRAKLALREAVLTRERERHATTRASLAERKHVAAERWRELKALRRQLRGAQGDAQPSGSGPSGA